MTSTTDGVLPLASSPKKEEWRKTTRFEFPLGSEDYVINFNERNTPKALEVPEFEEELEDLPSSSGNRFEGLLYRIKVLYCDNVDADDIGYESDSFIDDEESVGEEDDVGKTVVSGFFVNSGDIETKKRGYDSAGSEDDEEDSMEEDIEEYRIKRQKMMNEITLHVEVEEACNRLEEEWNKLYSPNDRPARFPQALETHLLEIAQKAYLTHPQNWITQDVSNKIHLITGFSPTTMKLKMKELLKKHPVVVPTVSQEDPVLPPPDNK